MTRPANSLFPEDIRSDIRTPFAILETQAAVLSEQTGGLLAGEVQIVNPNNSGDTEVTFDFYAPHIGFRFGVLRVVHKPDRPYPALVHADCFRAGNPFEEMRGRTIGAFPPPGARDKPKNEAASDIEFTKLLKTIFESSDVKGMAVSLIARSNEVLAERQRTAEGAALPPKEDDNPAESATASS